MFEKWKERTHWGQIVVGPPGAGKTTYCKSLTHVYPQLPVNSRQVCWINLDPANEIDVSEDDSPVPDIAMWVKKFGIKKNGELPGNLGIFL